ncbi:ENTP4 diphosphohydrolase, partial [Sakesphorus luctuosus]|nr:ENTP4 diphosphohydrolase [Sakesphorus luctuosus]
RLSISCLLPASWHFSLAPVGCPRPLRQALLAGAVLALLYCSLLLLRGTHGHGTSSWHRQGSQESTTWGWGGREAALLGMVVMPGQAHRRAPPELGKCPQTLELLHFHSCFFFPPGISEFANNPDKVSDYISPLLSFAAEHVPRAKHKETPLYILCTAGMRILPESQQKAILEDLLTDIPVQFDFLFSDSHAEVISGKQEGVYAWIGINFVLGRFEHTDDEEEPRVEVHIPGTEHQESILRKRTVGILDMGGVSTQIAYEVPKTVSFASSQQEEVAKNLLAEFNLGCDAHHTEHVYRVYVATFLGFGGNAARQRYEDSLFASTVLRNRLLGKQTGLSSDSPFLDPCLPLDAEDEIQQNGQVLHLRGTGDFQLCRELLQPFMNKTNETQTSLNGVYQPPVHFQNSEFYGFSEFYYCTEDVLRMGGDYNAAKFAKAAKDYCATKWSVLRERFDRGLYASHADLHRLKYQCFKSAWMYEVFHSGFSFPVSYNNLKTALQVYDKEVQWTLGAILYRTRFLPLRDIQQENFRGSHSHWRSFSFVYNHYLFFACFLVVLLSILLYLLRLRRIHRRMLRNGSSPSLWIEEGLPPPQKMAGPL